MPIEKDEEKEIIPRVQISIDVKNGLEEKRKEYNMTRSEMYEHALKFFLEADSFLKLMQIYIWGKNV